MRAEEAVVESGGNGTRRGGLGPGTGCGSSSRSPHLLAPRLGSRRVNGADAGFLAAVKAAFDGCAASTSSAPIDCPQYVSAIGQVANFIWKLDSDPMANAKVSFDGSRSLFQVTGTYSMTATFDETYPLQPTYHRVKTDSGNYTADLFWDGQKAVFVTFE